MSLDTVDRTPPSGRSEAMSWAEAFAQLDGALAQLRALAEATRAGDMPVAEAALLERAEALHRADEQLHALMSSTVVVIHERGACQAGEYLTTASFLRHKLQATPAAARARVNADLAIDAIPDLAMAYRAGSIPRAHADVIATTVPGLPEPMRADSLRFLLDAATSCDLAQLRAMARRLQAAADPDGRLAHQIRREEGRWLDIDPVFDDMVSIRGMVPAETGAMLRTALDALDQPDCAGEDPRTATQRRADGLAQLLSQVLDAGGLPVNGGLRPHLTVRIDLVTLVAWFTLLQHQHGNQPGKRPGNQPGDRAGGQLPVLLPGELDFGDLLLAPAARRLACDALVTPIITGNPENTAEAPDPPDRPDPLADLARLRELLPEPLRTPSVPLDVGRTLRLVPAHLRKALNLRDGGCVFDGCGAPPTWCHAHHVTHWADGGATSLDNLVLVCTRHHHAVHERGWTLHKNEAGRYQARPPERQ